MEKVVQMKDEFLGSKKNSRFSNFFLISNRKGQFAIEAVLLMTVLLGCFLALTKTLSDKKVVQKLVSTPMERVGRMAGYGTWNDECRSQGKTGSGLKLAKCHPNSIHRSLSSNPN